MIKLQKLDDGCICNHFKKEAKINLQKCINAQF